MRIALLGQAGSGKSAAARYLVDQWRFARLGIADPIKAAARTLGWNGNKDEPGRRMLQRLGDIARERDPDSLIRIFRSHVAQLDSTTNIVVDDVRLQPEAVALHALSFSVVRITGRAGDLGDASAHITEQIDDIDFDCSLWNGDSIAALRISIDHLLATLSDNRNPESVGGRRNAITVAGARG